MAGASAEEHHVINTTLEQQYAISTVRLLQLAQRRATNGNAGPLALSAALARKFAAGGYIGRATDSSAAAP